MFKKIYNDIFVEGLGGMASGLFVTMIIGMILTQTAGLTSGAYAKYLVQIGSLMQILTGAGIGIGMSVRYKQGALVSVVAAITGMIGAYGPQIMSGNIVQEGRVIFDGSGEPIGAFVAAYAGIKVAQALHNKTPIGAFLSPIAGVFAGALCGLWIGTPLSILTNRLGIMVNWGTVHSPFVMGIVVAVIMGLVFTLPFNAVTLAVTLKLSGLAGGAAMAGCCTHMVGFAMMGTKDNNIGGFAAQALGTSKIQISNIMKKMLVLIPPVMASAIVGPLSTCIFRLSCGPEAAGLGNTALLGPMMAYRYMMEAGQEDIVAGFKIIMVCFVLPALVTKFIAGFLKKDGVIKEGDLKINL